MHYPVRIRCCKRPNHDFCISQDSIAGSSTKVRWTKVKSFTSSFFVMLHAKNYESRPIFHGVIQNITLAHFLRHGIESLAYILPLIVYGSIFIQFFSGSWLPKTFYLCKSDVSAVQGHPRSFI